MNGIEVFDFNPSLIAMGRLEPLDSLGWRPKASIGLPADTPVLKCPVAAVDADCFRIQNADLTSSSPSR